MISPGFYVLFFFFSLPPQASFFFGCKDEAFRLVGQSSKNDNIVRCGEDGVWDFGDMRCEGPVCEDPGRPADGYQIAESYEQGSKVLANFLRILTFRKLVKETL